MGEDVTNELVECLNSVDASYKADLRQLNDLNFAQLKAEIAGLRGEVRAQIAGLRSELKGDMANLRAELTGDIQSLKAEMIKWMFLFWAGTALGGLLLR